ncbi:DUF5665 domain-containing protein [Acetonema longum]|uniref:Uncharacterized protein n=1 Tax=Acetonema longum DSM 6540 TaxID=1009370 RepID=F7NLC2_9FIRM|nr:DUF5665 domain-containing protein [Acetonema longum]EGO63227.1 hypothetical protein ALO_14472 [Acetonema longum DSM 6540]
MDDQSEKATHLDLINTQLGKLISHLETLRIAEYVELLQRPFRLLAINFIAGIARGLGIALGATVIFALVIELLRRMIVLNIPGIGDFIADIVRIVETKNGGKF